MRHLCLRLAAWCALLSSAAALTPWQFGDGEAPPPTHETLSPRIVGGQSVASAAGRSNYSFAVLLRVVFSQPSVSYQCGGTLVAPSLVLTAAHCVAKDPSPVSLPAGSATAVTAFLGWLDMSHWNGDASAASWPGETAGAEVIAGLQWEWHQLFDTGALNVNDVALIWLTRPTAHAATVTLERSPLAALPATLLALGWGITAPLTASQGVTGSTATVLQRVLLPTADGSFCAAQAVVAGAVYDDSRQLCTGTTGGVDTCYGDSGGPLLLSAASSSPYMPGVQVGIVSYGYGCGQPSAYAVNTRVQCMYPWIAHRVPSLAPGIAPAAPPAAQAAAALPPPPPDANGVLLFTLQASSVSPSLVSGLTTTALPTAVAAQLAPWGVPASRVAVAVTDASVFATLLVTNAPLGLWNTTTMAAFASGLATDVNVASSAVTTGCADVVSTSNILAGRRRHRRLLTGPPSTASPVLVPVFIGGLSANASLAAALATQLNGGTLSLPHALSAWLAATQRQAFPTLTASSPAPSQAPAATLATTLLVTVYLLPSMAAADAASASATLTAAMASGSLAAGVASAMGGNCTCAFGPVSLTPAPSPPPPPLPPGIVVPAPATPPAASASPPPPAPPPAALIVVKPPSSPSSSGTLIGLGVGIACGVVCIAGITYVAVVAARRRRARHMDSVEETIHKVRSSVLMDGLAAGVPMAHILTHPSMVNITAQELQAVAKVCLEGLQPGSPAWATEGEEEDTVPQELRVTSGPRRSMVRMSAPGELDEEVAYEDSAALGHLHHIEMRLSTASYQGRISRVSSAGSTGTRREPRLTTFDPYATRRTSLMLEATLHRLSSTSSTEWTDQDDAEVWRMSEPGIAPPPQGSGQDEPDEADTPPPEEDDADGAQP